MVYDRLGAAQGWFRFYKRAAVRELLAHGRFANARLVVEFGCGTGWLAERLLARHLSATTRYLALDISPTMVRLASRRVARFGSRAEVWQTTGEPTLPLASDSVDRIISTYVFEILPPDEIRQLLREFHRVLAPGGLTLVASVTRGFTAPSRLVERTWRRLYAARPSLVGGCRLISLPEFFPLSGWHFIHQARLTGFGVPSEVVVAAKVSE